MGYIRQTYLADILTTAGVAIVEVTDPVTDKPWQEHAAKQPGECTYEPVGLINHHTASVGHYPAGPWYPVDRLRLKCNLNIKPNGVVYVISAGYQYDSGYGDRRVLASVRSDRAAPKPTDTYNSAGKPAGPNPGVLLNPWFIDIECDHPGDGRPITDAQYEALIRTNAAILTHNSWGIHRLKGHLELTRRKTDPFWNQDRQAMNQVRIDTLNAMEDDMKYFLQIFDKWTVDDLQTMKNAGYWRGIPAWYFGPEVTDEAKVNLVIHVLANGNKDIPGSALRVSTETVEVVRAITVT